MRNEPLWRRSDNITSIDIDPGLFDILAQLATVAFGRGETAIAVRALVVRCYLGCHHANLSLGEMVCDEAIALLEKQGLEAFQNDVFAIRLLALRTAIDGGMLNRARMLATRLEIDFHDLETTCSAEQRFEYYVNRSDVHRIANDRHGAQYFLNLARATLPQDLRELDFVGRSHDIRLDPEGRGMARAVRSIAG